MKEAIDFAVDLVYKSIGNPLFARKTSINPLPMAAEVVHLTCVRKWFGKIVVLVSQYIPEAYVHKERKGHPQIAWQLKETVSKI